MESLRDHLVFVLPWRLQYGASGKNELKQWVVGKGYNKYHRLLRGL